MVAIGLRPAGLGRVAGPKEVPACGQQGIGGCDKDTGRLRHDEARTAAETAVATQTPTAVGELTVRTGLVVCQPIDHAAPIAVMQAASPLGSAAM